MFKSLKRKSTGERIVYIGVSLVFAIVALSYLYILFWMLMSGVKEHNSIVMDPFGLPETWHWEHFIETFNTLSVNGKGFWEMLFNSLWFSFIPVIIDQYTTVTFAYTCSKYKFPTSKWPYFIIMIMLTLPIYGSAGAAYRLMWQIGAINNYASALLSIGGFSMHYLYYQAYFKNLSWTYAEAAQMDGANDFQIYYKVMLPQAKPLITALALTGWIGRWNSYEGHLVNNPQIPTLPVGIYQFNTEMIYRARLDILFAACLLVCIPTLILFIIFNKTLTTNVSLGGIKG